MKQMATNMFYCVKVLVEGGRGTKFVSTETLYFFWGGGGVTEKHLRFEVGVAHKVFFQIEKSS